MATPVNELLDAKNFLEAFYVNFKFKRPNNAGKNIEDPDSMAFIITALAQYAREKNRVDQVYLNTMERVLLETVPRVRGVLELAGQTDLVAKMDEIIAAYAEKNPR